MNEVELKNLWQSSNDQFEQLNGSHQIDVQEVSQHKIQTLINSMKPIKFFALIIGLIWVGVGSYFLITIYLNAFHEANKFFLFSASLQVMLTAIAIIIYLYQLIKIYRMDVFGPVIQTQYKLAQLRCSTLWITKVLFLQLPLWTMFWWNDSMINNWSIVQWVLTLLITFSFTILSIWLFFNIKIENRHASWFKLIFNGNEWTPLMKSMDLLDQMEHE